jgi:small subunit ribosomal protein S9
MEFLAKAVGRRKEAVAQVQIKEGTGQFIINNKPAQEYLQNDFYKLGSVKAPFEGLGVKNTSSPNQLPRCEALGQGTLEAKTPQDSIERFATLDTIVTVKGGGLMGQTEAIRLGVSRALCILANNLESDKKGPNSEDPTSIHSSYLEVRKQLKDKGFLTQDSRVKERRKYGLRKARKASQYHKR